MNVDTGIRQWIERVEGPAALLRPSPWSFTPNAALENLLGPAGQAQEALRRAVGAGPGEAFDALARGQAFECRLRLAPGTGPARLLHASFAPLPGRGDWLATVVDLSPVERAHRRTALTLERLEHTLDQLNEPISMIDHEETMLFINAAYARFFATTRAEATGRKAVEVMGDNYVPTTPPRRELFRTLQPVRYERILLDNHGEERVMGILLWPLLDAQGRLAKMATLTRDVTLRHQGMETLRQTLERLDTLFEAGIEGVLLCEGGVIVDAHPVACQHIGLAREQLLGQPLRLALDRLGVPAVDDAELASLRLSLRRGAHGGPPLQIRAITFMDEDRPCQAVLLQDLSYRHQAQQRIDHLVTDLRWQTARAEAADHGKSVFLASASHDLRQPIHALGLFLTTLQSLGAAAPPLRSETVLPIAQRMRASLDSLMKLLNLLLGASLHDAGQAPLALRAAPLQAQFDELVSEFATTAAHKGLRLRAVPSRAWVRTDPTVLRRIVANLLSNAVRYTQQGRIVLGARRRGAGVEVQVWDTGIGIAPEQTDTIFQAFYRVDAAPAPDGRSEGLGLSIARRAAAQLGARLDVRSALGKGSMFSVLLPGCAAQAGGAPAADGDSPPGGTGRHILLIDDDEQVLAATAQLLASWGHRVLSAANAGEAMRRSEGGARPIDAVICDYMLDPAMDGLELLLHLRSRHPGPLPVCMVTGDMSAERIAQARQHGFTLLHKPVNASDLQRFLQANA